MEIPFFDINVNEFFGGRGIFLAATGFFDFELGTRDVATG